MPRANVALSLRWLLKIVIAYHCQYKYSGWSAMFMEFCNKNYNVQNWFCSSLGEAKTLFSRKYEQSKFWKIIS